MGTNATFSTTLDPFATTNPSDVAFKLSEADGVVVLPALQSGIEISMDLVCKVDVASCPKWKVISRRTARKPAGGVKEDRRIVTLCANTGCPEYFILLCCFIMLLLVVLSPLAVVALVFAALCSILILAVKIYLT
jgi:hypothetical protein